MPLLTKYRSLSDKEQALVALAILLDGEFAKEVLAHDRDRGAVLAEAAQVLSEMPLELQLPYVGTKLRRAIEKLSTAVE